MMQQSAQQQQSIKNHNTRNANITRDSYLVRLLAQENISLKEGNYETASFDVKNRVLHMPYWGNVSNDVKVMLHMHEVGHARFTAEEGWHDVVKDKYNAPSVYFNVIEDIRIEKLILRQYPGAIAGFKRGYSQINDSDFFGIKDQDLSEYNLIDRLNLKSKLRDLIVVPFLEEEIPYIQQCMDVETWEDVIAAAESLYAFVKAREELLDSNDSDDSNANIPTSSPNAQKDFVEALDEFLEEIPNNNQLNGNDQNAKNSSEDQNSDSDSSGEDDISKRNEKDQDSEESDDESSSSGSNGNADVDEETNNSSDKSESESEDYDDDSSDDSESEDYDDDDDSYDESEGSVESDSGKEAGKSDTAVARKGMLDNDLSKTDDAFRQNERNMVERIKNNYRFDVNSGPVIPICDSMNNEQIKDVLVPYEVLRKYRQSNYENCTVAGPHYSGFSILKEDIEIIEKELIVFNQEINTVAAVMAKEFEMKKAAYEYSRSKQSKSGLINTAMLSQYKFSSDIFLSVQQSATSKNHGIMMFVDMSGSMNDVYPDLLKQILIVTSFCKKVNIPFDVYGFTNARSFRAFEKDIPYSYQNAEYEINHQGIFIFHLLSSTFNKNDYKEAHRHLALQLVYRSCITKNSELRSRYAYMPINPFDSLLETLGGTPTVQALMVMDVLIERFIKKNQTQKMVGIVITDGQPQDVSIKLPNIYETKSTSFRNAAHNEYRYRMRNGTILGKGYTDTNAICNEIVDHIKNKYNMNMIGFFIAPTFKNLNSSFHFTDASYCHDKDVPFWKVRDGIKQDKFFMLEDYIGYNKYYFVMSDFMKNIDAKVELSGKGSVRNQFKKFIGAKNANRQMALSFAQTIS
jgi:hypothetical protein